MFMLIRRQGVFEARLPDYEQSVTCSSGGQEQGKCVDGGSHLVLKKRGTVMETVTHQFRL